LGRQSFEMMRSQPSLDRVENGATFEDRGLVIVPAPTLGELLDAIQARYSDKVMTFQWIEGKIEGNCRAYLDSEGGIWKSVKAPTDLLAAAALLMEVNK